MMSHDYGVDSYTPSAEGCLMQFYLFVLGLIVYAILKYLGVV